MKSNKKNPVCLFLNWKPPFSTDAGGAEQVAIEYLKAFAQNGYDILWVCPPENVTTYNPEVAWLKTINIGFVFQKSILSQLIYFPLFWFSCQFFLLKLRLKKTKVIIIDNHHGVNFLSFIYFGKRTIVYIHEVAAEIWNQMYPWYISYWARKIELISLFLCRIFHVHFVTGSAGTRDDLLKLGIKEQNILVCFHGVNFYKDMMSEVPKINNRILFLNRIVEMKGWRDFLRLAKLSFEQGKDFEFVLAGRAYGPSMTEVEKEIDFLGLKNVSLMLNISEKEKWKLYKESSVYCNLSYKEGWGLGNIEAAASGTPTVAFAVAGNTESIVNGKTGILVAPRDLRSLLGAIESLRDNPLDTSEMIKFSHQFKWEDKRNIFYQEVTRKLGLKPRQESDKIQL